MKMATVKRLHSGDEVTWNDPDNGTCSRTDIIQDISINGDVVSITWTDGTTVECYARELS